MKTVKIGTVNGYAKSTAWVGARKFEFDGTTRGLVISAIANGAKEGTTVFANYAGRLKSDARPLIIVLARHDNRAGGYWAQEVR